MPDIDPPRLPRGLSRREALLAAGTAVLAATGTRYLVPVVEAAPHRQLVSDFRKTLSPAQAESVFLPWDDPSRQLVNTLAIRRAPHLGTLLDASQMPYAWRLWAAMQSDTGRERLREPLKAEAGGLDGCVLTIYGDPDRGPCQSVISGGHLDLRAGTQPNGSFGDGIAWGHLVGNHELRVPGNVWAHHGDAVNALVARLHAGQFHRAVCAQPPNELLLQVQSAGGRFDGLPGSALDGEQRAALGEAIATVLASFAPAHAATAMDDIAANGGLEAMHLALYHDFAFYADGSRFPDGPPRAGERPYFQVWRIEGPGMILHFQGWPHVHAYLRLARDPQRQHVGESLAQVSQRVEGEPVRGFIEGAMQRLTEADAAFMPGPLPARFTPGPVTTGTLYTFDPYANEVVVASVRGDRLGAALRRRIGNPQASKTCRIATTDYAASAFGDELGDVVQLARTGEQLRHALIGHVRAQGLRSLQA